MTQQEKVTRRSVSMYDREWKIVEEVSEQYGLANLSAAIRIIVNQHGQKQPCKGEKPHEQR